MTKSMDSQLEALLSFDYVLTIILNNVWTCMAIVTAGAISFIWTTNKSSSPRFRQVSSPSVSPQNPEVVHSSCSCSPPLSKPGPTNLVSTLPLDCTDGVLKRGKFVLHYYNDEVQEEDYRGNVVCEEAEFDDVPDSVKFFCREMNMNWYRYMDLTVFSGNVVRLWD